MDSIIKVIPSDNPASYCRLCFTEKHLTALFPGGGGQKHFLVEQICQLIGINIRPVEEASSSICWRCALALEDFQVLRQRSLDHDAIIRNSKLGNSFEIIAVKEELIEPEQLVVNTTALDGHVQSSEVPEKRTRRSNRKEMDLGTTSDKIDDDNGESHDNTQNLVCNVCNAEFRTQSAMCKHVKEQHTEYGRPYQCSLCPSSFKRKEHLSRHMESHTGNRKFVCKVCNASYSKEISLVRHINHFHENSIYAKKPSKRKTSGNYQCTFCPKSFKHRPSLNTHVKSHYDILPYVCEICAARFAFAQGLSVHRGKFHTHAKTVDKPDMARFKCEHCPRFFESRSSLKEHIEVVHLLLRPFAFNSEGNNDESTVSETQELVMEYTEDNMAMEFKTEVEDAQLQG